MAVIQQKIVPHLWFDKEAREAAEFYCSVFPDSRITSVTVLPDTPSGDCDVVSFTLCGQAFVAFSAGRRFAFNEGISLMVYCETQEEIDYFWEKLSADPQGGQCGWLKDRYGLSWQIAPAAMGEMLRSGDPERARRVSQAFLQMKKLDLAALQRAYDGK